jgi:16S rRNA (cytosine1402-N4)-methyltransferase
MTGGGGRDHDDPGAAGGPARHIPVLREEVLAALDVKPGSYIDATFGAGGYTRAILATPGTKVLALDRDPRAIAGGADLVAASEGRLSLVESRFSALEAAAATAGVDEVGGIVFDIGVSSMQLDEAERGFSFRSDGPLDMRMGAVGPSAAELINTASEATLADIFYYFGEERMARRIARAIVNDRMGAPFLTTRALASLIERIVPAKPTEIHPATRSFQGLRIAVNDELRELIDGLCAAERMLKPDGRLAVVTFHSLEDRIVKLFFAARSGRGETQGRRLPGEPAASVPSFICPKGQPVLPGPEETARNPRARSAKLRFGIRSSAASHPPDPNWRALGLLPSQISKPGKGR